MPKVLRKDESAAAEAPERAATLSVKKQKLPLLLVTSDEALWPQIGADLNGDLALKQLDSIDELINTSAAAQPGIVLWDARGHAEPTSVLSRLNLHSSRFAIVVLDNAASAAAWSLPIQHRQVVAHVGLPIGGGVLASALGNAQEEVNARLALLGDGSEAATSAPVTAPPRKPWLIPAVAGAVAVAAVAIYLLTRHGASNVTPAPTAGAEAPKTTGVAAPKSAEASAEKVDGLMERAQQAMTDRHFIDPAAGSALSLYREVLSVDAANGEARQGLQRLAEILITRVQSALDERKFDVALQSLETARSIDPSDRRLAALDERIASLRAELGPAQIMAAINAQNFDRATQLIDEAARSKTVSTAKLAQLRDEVRKRREDVDVARLIKLVDTRIQQDHLIEPRNDSAVYYLDQARTAGATATVLQPQTQEMVKRLSPLVHAAIDQRRFADAERLLADLHTIGAPAAASLGLQRELSVARGAQASQKPDQPQFLELAQSRLAQGKLTEPDNDSALFYVGQLRSADPKNAGLAQISGAVQSQIVERARSALELNDTDKAESLLQLAASLGSSSDMDALNEKVRQKKAAASGTAQVAENSLTRLNKLDVQYPYRAMQSGVEGWVEIAYSIMPDGSVANVKVTSSTPAHVFESAAVKAVGKLKYQPVIQGGKPTTVATQIRVAFRIPK